LLRCDSDEAMFEAVCKRNNLPISLCSSRVPLRTYFNSTECIQEIKFRMLVWRASHGLRKFLNRTDSKSKRSTPRLLNSFRGCIYMYTRATEEDITVEITPGRAVIVGILCNVSARRSTLHQRVPLVRSYDQFTTTEWTRSFKLFIILRSLACSSIISLSHVIEIMSKKVSAIYIM